MDKHWTDLLMSMPMYFHLDYLLSDPPPTEISTLSLHDALPISTLEFTLDAVPETAAHLEAALAEAAARDAELARARANAAYAGEADPYRKPAEREADEPEE